MKQESAKVYCTQNDGDCFTCSLVNYGRDCRNNPIGSRKPVETALQDKDLERESCNPQDRGR